MIGFFDSGMGGLTILDRVLEQLPEYDYLYLGDSARNPYGNKSQKLIYEYTRQGVDLLMKEECRLVIVACNTASAKALRRLQQEWLPENYPDRRVLGVIIPVAEAAVEALHQEPPRKRSKKNKVGILGTEATIHSRTFEQELKKIEPKLRLYPQPAPLLVPLVEEGWVKRPETKKIIKYYLRPLKLERINALILACTHYPVLEKPISEIIGPQCRIISPPRPVAEKLRNYLERHPEIEKKLERTKKRLFYTTGDPEKFRRLGSRFLKQPLSDVRELRLDQ